MDINNLRNPDIISRQRLYLAPKENVFRKKETFFSCILTLMCYFTLSSLYSLRIPSTKFKIILVLRC